MENHWIRSILEITSDHFNSVVANEDDLPFCVNGIREANKLIEMSLTQDMLIRNAPHLSERLNKLPMQDRLRQLINIKERAAQKVSNRLKELRLQVQRQIQWQDLEAPYRKAINGLLLLRQPYVKQVHPDKLSGAESHEYNHLIQQLTNAHEVFQHFDEGTFRTRIEKPSVRITVEEGTGPKMV